jgi:hypothetical protein
LKCLTSLNLAQNFRISNAAVPALASLTRLTTLNLTHCRVNSAGIRGLAPLRNLATLAIKVWRCR